MQPKVWPALPEPSMAPVMLRVMLAVCCLCSCVAPTESPASAVSMPTESCNWGAVAACEARCAADDFAACSLLGLMLDPTFDHPSPWRKDARRALELFILSCDGAARSGCVELGNAYERGELTVQSNEKAREAFERACSAGYSEACVRLARRVDPDRAITALRRACELDDAEGCWTLGSKLLAGNTAIEQQEARSALMRGCTRGKSVASDVYSQAHARAFGERACQKLRDLKSSGEIRE